MAEYHRIFTEANGSGPWPCYGCGKSVTKLLIHHLDEDHGNDAPENLVAMHQPCHVKLHHDKMHSVEARAKIGDAHRGKIVSAETRAKMSVAHRGKPRSSETKRKISETMLGRRG